MIDDIAYMLGGQAQAEAAADETASASRGLFFFFQAEDGIRDYKVTGVQTCALPIAHRAGARGGRALLPRAPGSARALSAVPLAREALVPSAGKRVGGERGEPVLAGVAAARDLCEAGFKVALTRLAQEWPVGQGARKAEIAPRAAEVQPIEMRELSVVAVADSRRLDQRGRQFGQEGVEPAAKLRQHAAHEDRKSVV